MPVKPPEKLVLCDILDAIDSFGNATGSVSSEVFAGGS